MKKEFTIHKKNELIRGGDELSLTGKRILNVVYYLIQKNDLYNSNRFKVKFSIIKELMQIKNNNDYIERLQEGLMELMKTIELKNWENPLDGKTYKWYATRFVNEVSFLKENNLWYAIIEPNKTIVGLMKQKRNFTKIFLSQTNKLRTRYSVKMFEFFQSFKKIRYLDLPQSYLIKILGLEEKKTYKSYYELNRLLKRQVKEIAEKTDLEQLKLLDPPKDFKKAKLYRFIINPTSKQDLKDPKKIEKMMGKLFQRF